VNAIAVPSMMGGRWCSSHAEVDVRVLVTGATGFVGFAVADRLRRDGHEVYGLTRSGAPLPEGVERVVGDLCDGGPVLPVRFDAVCHLAALVRARESRADPVGYWRTNVGGTLAVAASLAAQQGPPARLVVASTCAVYGEQAGRMDETAQPRPTSPYASSKLAADRAVADVAATGVLGAISLRAFNVAGGLPDHPDRDETRLIPKAVAVARGRAAELVVNGDGSVVRDFVHVADMADAFVRALHACRPGRWTAYNVGAGRRSTVADVVAAVEEVAGRPLPVRHRPPVDEPAELLADAGRVGRELGWRPERSDLRRIVADAYAATGETGGRTG
jgi:UDP-glucose 4-epimerase